MNYFGHAVVAFEHRPDPAFVLGAMLPDLLPMWERPLGRKSAWATPVPGAVRDGIAFHHRTDAIFHACPTFSLLSKEALSLTRAAGVRKGPARAMAHLVVELCIDADLARWPVWQHAYVEALELGARAPWVPNDLAEGIDWLVERGAALHQSSDTRLTRVLGAALRGRSRLEPSADEITLTLGALAPLRSSIPSKHMALWRDLDSLLTKPHLLAASP